ncbi:MAG: bifunctional DNA primase/polymerase [Anaerolineales bacterium]|nr:bifunctional DNA primase/polymerase [Anaerolineales bacterium]
MDSSLDLARYHYGDLGFDTVPLTPGSKKAYAHGWEKRSSHRLWSVAPPKANIGIRGGGYAQVAFIDCDSPKTFETASRWLSGLGYEEGDYPLVRSASGGGRHIYVNFLGNLPGDWRKLSKDFGAGEFRYGMGAYVVAPPSMVTGGKTYSLIKGDLRQLPRLTLEDILPILGNKDTSSEKATKIPRRVIPLLFGKGIENYKSRSEAEQSILTSLINAGFSFAQVLSIFNQNQCAGKYAEMRTKNPQKAEFWLQKSYTESYAWANAHESEERQKALDVIAWAESTSWQGRTGPSDQLAFIAAAQIAYKAGRLSFSASCRDVAEGAGIGRTTGAKALHRLVSDHQLLELEKKAVGDCANVYRLNTDNAKLGHSLSTLSVRRCPSYVTHDVFRKGKGKRGLGKAAGQVWQILQFTSANIDELTEKTGRNKRTIKKVLDRMEQIIDRKTGEIFNMVEQREDNRWIALPVNLDEVAVVVETAGTMERQIKQHARERQEHRRSIEKSQLTKQNREIKKV